VPFYIYRAPSTPCFSESMNLSRSLRSSRQVFPNFMKPMCLRSRSGYFCRALSARAFVLRGFESGVNSHAAYLNRSHRSVICGEFIAQAGCVYGTRLFFFNQPVPVGEDSPD
jgi:hypothetical protein